MTTLMSTLTLLSVIAFSLVAGIGAGYVLIITILKALSPSKPAKREAQQLAPSTNQ